MTTEKPKTKRGGYRKGAGRPKYTGPYREPTKQLRIPFGLFDQVIKLLDEYRKTKKKAWDMSDIAREIELKLRNEKLYEGTTRRADHLFHFGTCGPVMMHYIIRVEA